jgi:hypothetical protein
MSDNEWTMSEFEVEICDYVVGLSRSLGVSICSRRVCVVFLWIGMDHTLMEVWNPIGLMGLFLVWLFIYDQLLIFLLLFMVGMQLLVYWLGKHVPENLHQYSLHILRTNLSTIKDNYTERMIMDILTLNIFTGTEREIFQK